MAMTPTQLILTPTFLNKQLVVAGTGLPAAYETVEISVIGAADVSANLVLRIVSECGRLEYGRFPKNVGDTWTVTDTDVGCSLDLNTPGTLLAFRGLPLSATRPARILLENGSTKNLYADGGLIIRNWVQNPLDPTVGSAQMQAQIDVLTARIGTHQHDDGTESAAFPHNNLTGRDVTGVHPTLEGAVASAVSLAANAQNTANAASSNASTALETAQAAKVVTDVLADDGAFTHVSATTGKLSDVKTLLNAIVDFLNAVRGA